MNFNQPLLKNKLLICLSLLSLFFHSHLTVAQKSTLTILKDSVNQIKSLNHDVYEEFYNGNVTELDTKLVYEIDEDLPYVYLLKIDSSNLRLYIPVNLEAEIAINDKMIEVITTNSSEFTAYVSFQNFFQNQVYYRLGAFQNIALDFRERIPSIDSAYAKLKANLIQDHRLTNDFLSFLDLEYKYLKRVYEKGYLIFTNKKFGKKHPAYPDRVMRGEKEYKKLDKYLDKNFSVQEDLQLNLLSPALVSYLSDNFNDKFFSDSDIRNGDLKYTKILIKKEAKRYGELIQSLVFFNHLNKVGNFEFVEYATVFIPFITHEIVSLRFNKKLTHLVNENNKFLDNYVFKKRHSKILSASTAIEGLNNFLVANKGKVILIDFWATWCGPCIANFPYSNKIEEELEGQEIVFLYVCMDADKNSDKALEMINQYNLGGNHIVIEDRPTNGETVKFKFSISSYPTYKIFDKEGLPVELNYVQPRMEDGKVLKNELLKVLNN